MNKKILIFGSSGFIGRNLQEYFQKKQYQLFTPTHKELDLLNGNEVNLYFKTCRPEIVINAALIGGSREEEYEEGMLYENLRIFFNIVINKKYFKKMIHLGSGAEYDKRTPIRRVKEEDFGKRMPVDEYGFYKYICSKYIEEVNDIVCLRIFGLWGKYEDWRYRFISNAICRNLFDLPITLKQDVYFDYVYINDFLKIIDFFITNRYKHKFYNMGTGKRINLLAIAHKINNIADKKSKIIVGKKGFANEYTCCNFRLLEELGKFEFTNFDQALRELYDWYKLGKKTIKANML